MTVNAVFFFFLQTGKHYLFSPLWEVEATTTTAYTDQRFFFVIHSLTKINNLKKK